MSATGHSDHGGKQQTQYHGIPIINEDGIGHEMMSVFAWVACDPKSGEGIMAFVPRIGVALPLVFATADAALKAEPVARDIGKTTRRTVKLLRFDSRHEVSVIEP